MAFRSIAAIAILAAIINCITPGDAFSFVSKSTITKPVTSAKTVSRSALYMGPPTDPSAPVTELYGEGSRKYRRTVYTHNEWVKHRSSDRFINNLSTLFNSGIYKNIGKEVALVTVMAMFVWGWNLLVGGYQDLAGVMHDPILKENWAMMIGLPLTPFTVLNSSLGLLLGEIDLFCNVPLVANITCSYLVILTSTFSLHLHII